jgi:tetratricopeptide (TPR) repeat protein
VNDEASALDRARAHASRGELDEAEAWIGLALEREPLLASAHYVRGLILQESGRADEALAALRRCLYAAPGFALAHMAMASVLQRSGDPKRAARSLDNAASALSTTDARELVAEGGGLTAGGLLQIVDEQRQVVAKLLSARSAS